MATSFRKSHILQPEDSSQERDSNPRSGIGGRLGKQTLTVTPRIAPSSLKLLQSLDKQS